MSLAGCFATVLQNERASVDSLCHHFQLYSSKNLRENIGARCFLVPDPDRFRALRLLQVAELPGWLAGAHLAWNVNVVSGVSRVQWVDGPVVRGSCSRCRRCKDRAASHLRALRFRSPRRAHRYTSSNPSYSVILYSQLH